MCKKLLTAKEALAHYEGIDKVAEKFFLEVIQPKIEEVYDGATSITLELQNCYYVGTVFEFSNNYYDFSDKDLTKKIRQLLIDLGYAVFEEVHKSGTEWSMGYATWKVSWAEAKIKE